MSLLYQLDLTIPGSCPLEPSSRIAIREIFEVSDNTGMWASSELAPVMQPASRPISR